jgi:AAA+ superfamily predicted ATPase
LLEVVNSSPKAHEVFTNIFHFDDLHEDALYKYALQGLRIRECVLTSEASDSLYEYMRYVYSMRGNRFTNTSYIDKVIENQILPHMIRRVVGEGGSPQSFSQMVIEAADIPEVEIPDPTDAIAKLNALVGLDDVKRRILAHTSLVRLNKLRADRGLYNRMPPMHMVFTGNPGTGKTTIAKYIGEIYHSIGVLSSGHVVVTDRSKLVGEFIGDAEKNTTDAINSASGGVLFIDEAYNLFTEKDNKKDYGMRVIETLLTYLGSDDTNMIVILAGYTGEMNRMLEANPGMKSRFPYIFQFEDYTPEQLMQIGKKVLED